MAVGAGRCPPFPENDGSNSCAFLCVSLAHCIYSSGNFSIAKPHIWEDIAGLAETVIKEHPLRFNYLRDKGRCIDVLEAYQLLRGSGIVLDEYEFTEECLPHHPGDPAVALEDLRKSLVALKACTSPAVGIYTCGGYIFLTGSISGALFLLDTQHWREFGGYWWRCFGSIPSTL